MDGAVIEYHYDGKLDTEITIGYNMTKCIDELPSSTIYPPVVTKVVQTEEIIEEARKDFNNGDVHTLLAENEIIRLDEDEDGVSRSEVAANDVATINNQDRRTIERLDASRILLSTGSRACADSRSTPSSDNYSTAP